MHLEMKWYTGVDGNLAAMWHDVVDRPIQAQRGFEEGGDLRSALTGPARYHKNSEQVLADIQLGTFA